MTIDFGSMVLNLNANYAQIDIQKPAVVSVKDVEVIVGHLKSYYKKSSFPLISNRMHTVDYDLKACKLLNKTNISAIAVVLGEHVPVGDLCEEQASFNKSFAKFDSVEDAKSWISNFIQ